MGSIFPLRLQKIAVPYTIIIRVSYQSFFLVLLMQITQFSWVDIGANVSASDAQLFNSCLVG